MAEVLHQILKDQGQPNGGRRDAEHDLRGWALSLRSLIFCRRFWWHQHCFQILRSGFPGTFQASGHSASRSILHVIPIRDGTVLNGYFNVKTQRLLCASSPTKQRRPAFISRPGLAATIATIIKPCDPGGHPLRFAPRSPRHEGSNTHLTKNTLSQNGYGLDCKKMLSLVV